MKKHLILLFSAALVLAACNAPKAAEESASPLDKVLVRDFFPDVANNLPVTDANKRAVRILAYNRMEITKESILTMKTGDEMVQRTLKNLTPGVVKNLIDEGKNPLDLSMEKLL